MQGTQHTAITYCTGMFQNAEWEKSVCCINADTEFSQNGKYRATVGSAEALPAAYRLFPTGAF